MTTETEFMSELEAATRMRSAKASNLLLVSITALVLFFVVWANVSEIEELTRGAGQIVPSQEIQVVQSLEGGILEEILVTEGDNVRKGQILLRISDVAFASEERGVEARFLSLRAKKSRLTAESRGEEFVMPVDVIEKAPKIAANEAALYKSRQMELDNAIAILKDSTDKAVADQGEAKAQIKRLQDSRALLRQELAITQKMVAQKAVPKLDEIRLRRELSDISGQLNVQKEKQVGLAASLSSVKNQLADQKNKFQTQALGEMGEVEGEMAQLEESLKSIGDRVDRRDVRAPVDGIVNKIAIKTIGGVIEPAHKLAEIVPVDDELKVIARVRPDDIAFLEIGQKVSVKVSAYDPQRYGSLEGRLVRIAANSVTDRDGNVFFEIEVRTDRNYLGTEDKPLPITPGMVAQTEVITGKRTIMEYLMKPILRARSVALTER